MRDQSFLAGIDVGWSTDRKSTGICCTGARDHLLSHTTSDEPARKRAFGPFKDFSILAIDAPLLPVGTLDTIKRAVEMVFYLQPFNVRCRPGYSHIRGTGTRLRIAGKETSEQFLCWIKRHSNPGAFPQVHDGTNLLEAFPNAFLGVMLPDEVFRTKSPRGKKFDWLYDECNTSGFLDNLRQNLKWGDEEFWVQLRTNSQHDERGALICVLTAMCVYREKFVAVGNKVGGYFFLPPWNLWQKWAKEGLEKNRLDRRLPEEVEVWINGQVFLSGDSLP